MGRRISPATYHSIVTGLTACPRKSRVISGVMRSAAKYNAADDTSVASSSPRSM